MLSSRRPAGPLTGVPQPGSKDPKRQNQLDKAKQVLETEGGTPLSSRRPASRLTGVPQPRGKDPKKQN